MKRIRLFAIIAIAIILVTAFWYTQTYRPKSTPTVNPIATSTTTLIESTPSPSPQPSIDITYYATFVQQIGSEIDPPSIHFLIVNMTITNNGYLFFDTSFGWFYFTGSDGISYQSDFGSNYGYIWKSLLLSDGSSISGTLVCSEVPSTVNSIISITYGHNTPFNFVEKQD